jgi:hypothetical protein
MGLDRYYKKYYLDSPATGADVDQPLAPNATAVARGGFWGSDATNLRFRIDPNRRAIQLTAASVFVVRLIIREFVTHVTGPSRKNCTGLRQVFGTAARITSGTGVRPRHANQFHTPWTRWQRRVNRT